MALPPLLTTLIPGVIRPAVIDTLVNLPTDTGAPSVIVDRVLRQWVKIAWGTIQPSQDYEGVVDYAFNNPDKLGFSSKSGPHRIPFRSGGTSPPMLQTEKGPVTAHLFVVQLSSFYAQFGGGTPVSQAAIRSLLGHLVVSDEARGDFLGVLLMLLLSQAGRKDLARWHKMLFQSYGVSRGSTHLLHNAWIKTKKNTKSFALQGHGIWFDENGAELGPVKGPFPFKPDRLATPDEIKKLAKPWLAEHKLLPLIVESPSMFVDVNQAMTDLGDPDVLDIMRSTFTNPYMTHSAWVELLLKKALLGTW